MAPISLTERATVNWLEQVGQPSCFAYSQRGQICGEALAKIGQPHSLQLMTGSPNMPRTIVPQRRPPQVFGGADQPLAETGNANRPEARKEVQGLKS